MARYFLGMNLFFFFFAFFLKKVLFLCLSCSFKMFATVLNFRYLLKDEQFVCYVYCI